MSSLCHAVIQPDKVYATSWRPTENHVTFPSWDAFNAFLSRHFPPVPAGFLPYVEDNCNNYRRATRPIFAPNPPASLVAAHPEASFASDSAARAFCRDHSGWVPLVKYPCRVRYDPALIKRRAAAALTKQRQARANHPVSSQNIVDLISRIIGYTPLYQVPCITVKLDISRERSSAWGRSGYTETERLVDACRCLSCLPLPGTIPDFDIDRLSLSLMSKHPSRWISKAAIYIRRLRREKARRLTRSRSRAALV